MEALQSQSAIDRIIVSHSSKQRYQRDIIPLANKMRIKLQVIPEQKFKSISEEGGSQGIIAYVAEERFITIETVLNNQKDYPVIVVLDHLQDPYNFGAILRTCEALGVTVVIYPKDRNAQLSPGVIKSASGATEHLSLIKATNIKREIRLLQEHGYFVVGTDSQATCSLNQFKPQWPLVVVLGNENKGLAPHLAKRLDAIVSIPLKGKVGSLNVSVAAGIILHTVLKDMPTNE